MSPYLPGHPPRPPTSLVPPLLQLGMGIGLLGLAWWAYEHAKVARATDAWAFNGLSAVSVIAGVLWMPFAVIALGIVLRNRRRKRTGHLNRFAPDPVVSMRRWRPARRARRGPRPHPWGG